MNEWDTVCTHQTSKKFLKIITMRIFSFIFSTYLKKKILFPTKSSIYSHEIFCKKIKLCFLTLKPLRHLELDFVCGMTHRASLVAQTVKNLPAMQETQVRSLEKRMATYSSILAWRIPWTEEPGGLQSMGSQRVRHDWATKQQQQKGILLNQMRYWVTKFHPSQNPFIKPVFSHVWFQTWTWLPGVVTNVRKSVNFTWIEWTYI